MTERKALDKTLGEWGEKIGLMAYKKYTTDDWSILGYKVLLKRNAPYPIYDNPRPYDGYMTMEAIHFDDKNEFLLEVKTNNKIDGEGILRISIEQMDRYIQISKDVPIDYVFIYVDAISKSIYKISQNEYLRCAERNNNYYSAVLDSDDIIANIEERNIIDMMMLMKKTRDKYSRSLFD